jgi:hypothetical protein
VVAEDVEHDAAQMVLVPAHQRKLRAVSTYERLGEQGSQGL